MAYDRVLVLAASQDEATAFGRAFGLDVQFCTGPHNLFAHRTLVELESFADARKFAVQNRLQFWDQESHNIHMYVEDADWAKEREITAPPTRLRTDGYPIFSGIEVTGDDSPSSRGTNAQRRQFRAIPEPQVDEDDELRVALEGGKRSREPEVTGKYVVSLSEAEVAARKNAPVAPVGPPKAETVVEVKDEGADEQRWDDNGGAGRPERPAKKAAARRTAKNVPDTPPTKPAPDGF